MTKGEIIDYCLEMYVLSDATLGETLIACYDETRQATINEAVEALSTLLAEGYIECKYIEQAQARLRQILSNT